MSEVKGYHLRKIEKGVYGTLSKVREELEEAEDALQQDNKIMLLVELSDLYGALEAYLELLNSSMDELKIMSDATKRAFHAGHRINNEIIRRASPKLTENWNIDPVLGPTRSYEHDTHADDEERYFGL